MSAVLDGPATTAFAERKTSTSSSKCGSSPSVLSAGPSECIENPQSTRKCLGGRLGRTHCGTVCVARVQDSPVYPTAVVPVNARIGPRGGADRTTEHRTPVDTVVSGAMDPGVESRVRAARLSRHHRE